MRSPPPVGGLFSHLIAPAALGNAYAICLNKKEPKDIGKAAVPSLAPSDEMKLFSRLPVGHAVVTLRTAGTLLVRPAS